MDVASAIIPALKLLKDVVDGLIKHRTDMRDKERTLAWYNILDLRERLRRLEHPVEYILNHDPQDITGEMWHPLFREFIQLLMKIQEFDVRIIQLYHPILRTELDDLYGLDADLATAIQGCTSIRLTSSEREFLKKRMPVGSDAVPQLLDQTVDGLISFTNEMRADARRADALIVVRMSAEAILNSLKATGETIEEIIKENRTLNDWAR